MSEARVAAHTHASDFASWLPYPGRPGGDRDEDDDEDDDGGPEPREAWALDKLCEALLVKGALVPVSRKSVQSFLTPLSVSTPQEKSPELKMEKALFQAPAD